MKYTPEALSNLKYTNFLIIGPTKNGKTFSCGTLHKLRGRSWVKGKKLHIHDFDDGCQPIIDMAERERWIDEVVPFRYSAGGKISTDENVNTTKEPALEFLRNINSLYDHLTPQNEWKEDFINDAPYAIVVDSLTSLQDSIQSFLLALSGKMKDNELSGEVGTMFRKQKEKVIEIVRSIRALPCYSVFCAHVQLSAETVKQPWTPKGVAPLAPKLTGQIRALPVVTGQLASTIGGEFGGVLYTKTTQLTSTSSKYEWITQATGDIPGAGTRLKTNLPLFIPQDFNLVVG